METLANLIEDTFNIPVHIPDYREEIDFNALGKVVRDSREIALHLKSREILAGWQEAAAAVTKDLESLLCAGCQEPELTEAEIMLHELSLWLEEKLQDIRERRGVVNE